MGTESHQNDVNLKDDAVPKKIDPTDVMLNSLKDYFSDVNYDQMMFWRMGSKDIFVTLNSNTDGLDFICGILEFQFIYLSQKLAKRGKTMRRLKVLKQFLKVYKAYDDFLLNRLYQHRTIHKLEIQE